MTLSATKIKELSDSSHYSSLLKFEHGELNKSVTKATEPKSADGEALVYVSTEAQLLEAIANKAPIVIAHQKLLGHADIKKCPTLFSTPAIPATMALLLPFLDDKRSRFEAKIHPTAVIHPTAKLGKSVGVSPYAVIGEDVVIGDDSLIGSHTVVEKKASIGKNTILHPHVFIGAKCKIGNNCEIHPHSTIGSDGFGFVQAPDLKRHKIPQLGIVVIEDDVEIGGNCAIDRSTFSETRIGRGTKMDNLCHIAHNVVVGQNNAFAGALKIAGSTTLGSNIVTGGNVDITDHVTITDNVSIGGKSGISKDIDKPGAYVGFPAEPFKDGLKTLTNLSHITKMRKQLAKIQKHLGLTDEE